MNNNEIKTPPKRASMSPRAKRVLVPWFVLGLVLLAGFMIHMVTHGTTAFPAGKFAGGRYLVEDHGKVIEFTRETFWLSYCLGVASTVTIVSFLLAVLAFYCSGDLTDKDRNT